MRSDARSPPGGAQPVPRWLENSAFSPHPTTRPLRIDNFPVYDTNGNVHGLVATASVTINGTAYSAGSLVASYEFDAFGNTLRESGDYAASNSFRFATKYADVETGLVQYNTRYYAPSLGRFINRDSIGEQGGLNLYAYCGNNGVSRWDYLGNIVLFSGYIGLDRNHDSFLATLAGHWDPFGVFEASKIFGEDGIFRSDGGFGLRWSYFDNEMGPDQTIYVGPLVPIVPKVHSPLLDRIPEGKENSKIRILNTDPNERAKIEALLDRIRNLASSQNGGLTQAALLLRKLEASGLAGMIEINASFPGPKEEKHRRSHGETEALDPQGTMYDVSKKINKGDYVLSRINLTMDTIAEDEIAVLAHELVHGIQYAIGAATRLDEAVEKEATRVGNEAFDAIHDKEPITDSYWGEGVSGWNRYIPWVKKTDTHK